MVLIIHIIAFNQIFYNLIVESIQIVNNTYYIIIFNDQQIKKKKNNSNNKKQ